MSILKVVADRVKKNILAITEDLMLVKYNYRSYLCVVSANKDKVVSFKCTQGLIAGGIVHNENWCKCIRRSIGESILLGRGLPKPDEEPYQVILIPMPSLFVNLGLNESMKFIKDWNGNSMVGDIEVVRYSTLR